MSDNIFVVMESSYVVNGNTPTVMLYSRDYHDPTKSYTHKFDNFEPYLYVPADEAWKVVTHPHVKRVEDEVVIDALGREIKRVVTRIPADVPKVRDATDNLGKRLLSWTDMADFIFDKRFLVDKHIKYAYRIENGEPVPVDVPNPVPPRIVYCDIEVLSPQGIFPDAKQAAYPIITIQVMDSITQKIIVFTSDVVPQTNETCHIVCKNEQDLIKTFCTYIKTVDPDIVGGWNFEQFDIPYLINRAKNLSISLYGFSRFGQCRTEYDSINGEFSNKIGGRACLDMMAAFKKYNIGMGQRESFGLKSVISDKDLLNKFDKDGNTIESFAFEYLDLGPMLQKVIEEQRFDDLIDYCKNDVIALHNIDTSLGLYMYFESIRFVAGSKITDSLYNSKIIEMLLLHEGIRPMPSRVFSNQPKDKFPGALVVTPSAGIHEYVQTVDVSSMYPNIMVGFNINPDIDGIVVQAMKKIMALREHYRSLKKQGVKGADALDSGTKAVSNSFYGVLGSPAFRLYNRENAYFVTKTGQDINKYIQQCAGELNLSTIYGDSVGGNTEVKVYNSKGRWKYTTIEELFTQVDFVRDDKEYCNLIDCFVESIDSDGKLILDSVPYVMRHKCNKDVYKVALTSDWSIEVTEDHSLFVYANKAVLPKAAQKHRIVTCSTKELCEGRLKSVIIRRCSKHSHVESLGKPITWYEYLGYHVGNGSLQHSVSHNNKAYYGGVSFGDDSQELYPHFIPFMEKEGYFTNVFRDSRSGHEGDIRYSGLEFIHFIEEHIGHSHEKQVPDFMFNETIENIQAFVRGYFTADGTVMMRSGLPIVRLTSVNKNLIIGVQRLLYILGIPSSYFTEGKPNSYNGKVSGTYSTHLVVSDIMKFRDEVGFITSRKQERMNKCNPLKVEKGLDWTFSSSVKKELIPNYDGYVYDLHCKQTNRYFANNILVHNTDSCFVSPVTSVEQALQLESYFNKKLIEWCDEKGCTVHITLKAEKLFRRILFKASSGDRNKSSKKKYAGYLIWHEGHDVNELSFMGLELKRSDQSNITKDCLSHFLNTLLIDGNQTRAIEYIKDMYKKVKKGQVNALDISLPKAIRKISYESSNPWVTGIEYAKNEYGYIIGEGIKPRLLYLRDGVVCIDEDFDIEQITPYIDWDKMADVTIKKKMESYLWSLNLDWSSMIDGQKDLSAWF